MNSESAFAVPQDTSRSILRLVVHRELLVVLVQRLLDATELHEQVGDHAEAANLKIAGTGGRRISAGLPRKNERILQLMARA